LQTDGRDLALEVAEFAVAVDVAARFNQEALRVARHAVLVVGRPVDREAERLPVTQWRIGARSRSRASIEAARQRIAAPQSGGSFVIAGTVKQSASR